MYSVEFKLEGLGLSDYGFKASDFQFNVLGVLGLTGSGLI